MDNWQDEFDKIYGTDEFDHDWYRDYYSDIQVLGLSPLEHYLKYGRKMGRLPRPDVSKITNQRPNDESLPLVSIICITYNQEKFIAQTIESILEQETDFDFELLIGNDNSSDNTHGIITRYANKFSRIRYFNRKSNMGANSNFVDLSKHVRGKYVAICEGDDYWIDRKKLQKQINILTKNPEYTICFHPVRILYDDNPDIDEVFPSPRPSHLNLGRLLKSNFIQTNSVVYKWRFTETHGLEIPYNIAPADWYIHLLHAEVGRIAYLDEIMSVYRKHSTGMWSAHANAIERFKKHGNQEIAFYRALEKRYGGDNKFKDAQNYIFASLANLFMANAEFDNLLKLIHSNGENSSAYMRELGFSLEKTPASAEHLKNQLISQSKVDIIVTSYNHANYIGRCLDSILNQKGLVDFHVIIGDDKSTDQTGEIVRSYKELYPEKITVLDRPNNLGMLKNLEDCIKSCKADYVAFCEADDYWLSDSYLSKKLSIMRRDRTIGMCFNWLLLHIEDTGTFLPHDSQGRLQDGHVSFATLENQPLTANFSCCMYTKEALDSIPLSYFDRKSAADWLLNLYVANAYKVFFTREILSVYTVHPKGQWSGIGIQERIRLEKLYRGEFQKIFPDKISNYSGDSNVSVRERNLTEEQPGIRYYLDEPHPGCKTLSKRNLAVSGWVLRKNYKDYSIILRYNSKELEVAATLERPDVMIEVYGPDHDEPNLKCGFRADIDLGSSSRLDIFLKLDNEVVPWTSIEIS